MQRSNQKLPKEALLKTSTVLAGQASKHIQQPFALNRYIAFRELVVNVILPAKNKTKETFPHCFRIIDNAIGISEHKGVSQTSESSRYNLQIASRLSKDDVSKRGPIFEL